MDIKHLAYYVAQSTCSINVIGCYNYCNSHVLGIYFRDIFLKNMEHKDLWSIKMVASAQIYNLGQVIKGLGGNTIFAANDALEQQFSTLFISWHT